MADLFDVKVGGAGWHLTSHLIALAALFVACFAITGYITFRDDSVPGSALKDHDADLEDITADTLTLTGNATVGGVLSVTDTDGVNRSTKNTGRYYLEEYFSLPPALEAPTAVTQATNITTAVVSPTKYTIITTQATGALTATAWTSFTFTNTLITANSVVTAFIQDDAQDTAGTPGPLLQVADIAAGSCKLRLLNPDEAATTTAVLKIFVAVDPQVGVNQHLCAAGTNMTDALVAYSTTSAGLTITTAGADQDQAIIQPRTTTSQEGTTNGGAPTAWTGTLWGTENYTEWECMIRTNAIDNQKVWAGLKDTNDQLIATDDDQAFFKFQTDATNSESFTDFTKLHFVYSVGGTDYISQLPITVAANTNYHLKIEIDGARKAAIFVNGTQYNVTATAGSTGGTAVTAGTTRSLALTNDVDLKPYIGIEAGAAAAESLDVAYQAINRLIFE